jgi:cell division transport system permease protein
LDLKTAFGRAKRGLREDFRLYLVAVSSLTVAFLCLGATLLAVQNLDILSSRWGGTRRMTVYLVDGARPSEVEQLVVTLDSMAEVTEVEHMSAARARAQFLEQTGLESDLGELGADVFPATIEVSLASEVTVQRAATLAQRVERFAGVDDVETYAGWFGQLESLLSTGRGLATGLALLVVLCVLAVVGNTIRLALASRRSEIEVLKLCGATDGFVRTPLVLEGALSGLFASVVALLMLAFAFLALRTHLDGSLAALTGIQTVFLSPATVLAIVFGGTAAGAAGSALSLRRYLVV